MMAARYIISRYKIALALAMESKQKPTFEKITDYVLQFRDVRAVGLLLFLLVVLMISWSGVKAIDTNYRLQKQISRLEQQVAVQKLQNTNTKLQNQYLETNQYLEIAARQNFGLAAPGETVLNVPQSAALAQTVDLPDTEQAELKRTQAKQPAYQRHFQAWINFLLHRSAVQD
jgi:cell division protein FtsB